MLGVYDDTVTVGPPQVERDPHPFVGFVDFQGLPVDLENLRGSIREGYGWSTVMLHHYGEVRDTVGADGDPLDVYIGPDATSPLAVVVHQHVPETGEYDEDKVMLGFREPGEAIDAYLAQYDEPGFYGGHTVVPLPDLLDWCALRRGEPLEKGWTQRYVVTMAKGGPYVGPHGGMWADPEHHVHWQPTKHGDQGDWVGAEDEKKAAARKKRVNAALDSWHKAAAAYKDDRSQRAYQRAYNALDELGRALNLDVPKGDDYARASLRWLKAHGHPAKLAEPKRARAVIGQQESLFKALPLHEALDGFGDVYRSRLYAIIAA